MEFIFQLVLVILLVFLNGFFVASEFALVGVRKTRIDELVKKGNSAAKLVQNAINNLDSYISATQLGITLASLALGWIGEPAIARFLEPNLGFLGEAALISSHTIAIALAFTFITFLHIVLGELAPKTVALQRAENTSLFLIVPLTAFTTLFKPFIWILNGAGSMILRPFGLHAPSGHQLVHSEEEIRMILAQSQAGGLIPKGEVEMVYNVFNLGDTSVKQIMVPRTDIISFNVATPLKEVVKKIRKHTHSRFPVYEQTIDNVVGFIHVKDIYQEALKPPDDKKLSETDLIRKIINIPEVKKVDQVLLDMQRKRIHMAIVNDEYGGTSGLVTLEDIIEGVVGEIEDEFEKPLKEIQRQPDGTYLIDGLASIERVQRKFNLPIKGMGYTTIGGFVFGLLGHEPRAGDNVQIGNIIFGIEQIEGRRIKTVSLKREGKKRTS